MNTKLQSILLAGLDRGIQEKRAVALADGAPSKGWLRAVREALDLSQREIAERMGVRQQPYAGVEKREESGTVSLSTLRRAADALDCELVYFLVPKEGVARSFTELAGRTGAESEHLRATEHSMALEGQAVGDLPPPSAQFPSGEGNGGDAAAPSPQSSTPAGGNSP
jgi:predicted DNA-binding mobile mystery protein A